LRHGWRVEQCWPSGRPGTARACFLTGTARHGLVRGRHDSIGAGPEKPTGREIKKSTTRTLCVPGPSARRPEGPARPV
jgi:hypothetical protein